MSRKYCCPSLIDWDNGRNRYATNISNVCNKYERISSALSMDGDEADDDESTSFEIDSLAHTNNDESLSVTILESFIPQFGTNDDLEAVLPDDSDSDINSGDEDDDDNDNDKEKDEITPVQSENEIDDEVFSIICSDVTTCCSRSFVDCVSVINGDGDTSTCDKTEVDCKKFGNKRCFVHLSPLKMDCKKAKTSH